MASFPLSRDDDAGVRGVVNARAHSRSVDADKIRGCGNSRRHGESWPAVSLTDHRCAATRIHEPAPADDALVRQRRSHGASSRTGGRLYSDHASNHTLIPARAIRVLQAPKGVAPRGGAAVAGARRRLRAERAAVPPAGAGRDEGRGAGRRREEGRVGNHGAARSEAVSRVVRRAPSEFASGAMHPPGTGTASVTIRAYALAGQVNPNRHEIAPRGPRHEL